MMKSLFLYLVLLGTFLNGNCLVVSLNTNELEARKFVEVASKKLHTFSDELSLIEFELATLPSHELLNHFDKFMDIVDKISDITRESKQFNSSQFKDEELKYIFEFLSDLTDEAILGRSWFEKILKAYIELDVIGTTKNMSKFGNKKVKLALIPDVENIIAHTNNTRELKYYWKQWRDINSKLVLQNLKVITDGLLKGSEAAGIPGLKFWMGDLNITEMERVMNETQPLYLQLHAFIRSQLHKKYGDEVIKPDGIIPDHLFRQIVAQSWTNSSIIEEMFPLEKLPPYDEIFKQNNFNAEELFKTADRFYKSLGFDSLPESYWGSQIKISLDKDEDDCKPQVSDLTKKVYMTFCEKVDFKTFLQAHGYMGHIYYAREMTDLPAYYFYAYNLEEAVGEAATLSASTLGHLKTIGLLDDFKITEDIEFQQLLRMGFHTLLNIPQHYVHAKVMADFAAGDVEFGLLNQHYWNLMDKYVGVGPPMHRLTNTFDFPEKFYIDLSENSEGLNFFIQIFGYQFYKKLCQISGKYPNEPLHKCDFFGNKDVGDSLKKMMKLGSSKRLNKVLETVFAENPYMSSAGLLEYYSPMERWLTEQNEEANVKLGWTHSDKKVKKVFLNSGEEYDDEIGRFDQHL